MDENNGGASRLLQVVMADIREAELRTARYGAELRNEITAGNRSRFVRDQCTAGTLVANESQSGGPAGGSEVLVIITWRVVAIDSTGSRIIVDEQLSAERANEVRDLMIQRGHNAIVEAEVPAEQNGNPHDLPVDPIQWTADSQSGSREATIAADPP